ncbi:hypothetical protein ACNJ7E_13165 [Rhodococcus sp. NM-2]
MPTTNDKPAVHCGGGGGGVKTADTALMGENLLKLPESIHLASAPWP